MYNLFEDAAELIYRKPKVEDPRPDNLVFRLHYQYTFSVLAVSVILVTSYHYIDTEGLTTKYHQKILVPSFKVLQSNVWRTKRKFLVMS